MQSQKFMWVGRDFFGIAEFGIVNNNNYWSYGITMEQLSDPKLSVWTIEKECRRHLGGL